MSVEEKQGPDESKKAMAELERANERTSRNIVVVKEYFGLSHQELAKRMKLKTGQAIARLIRKDNPDKITDAKLAQFASALGMVPSDLSGWELKMVHEKEVRGHAANGWQAVHFNESVKDIFDPDSPFRIIRRRPVGDEGLNPEGEPLTLYPVSEQTITVKRRRKAPIRRASPEVQDWFFDDGKTFTPPIFELPYSDERRPELMSMSTPSNFTFRMNWIAERGNPDTIGLLPLRGVLTRPSPWMAPRGAVLVDVDPVELEVGSKYIIYYRGVARLAFVRDPRHMSYRDDFEEQDTPQLLFGLSSKEMRERREQSHKETGSYRASAVETIPLDDIPVDELHILGRVIWYCVDM